MTNAAIEEDFRIRKFAINFDEKPPYFAVDGAELDESALADILSHDALTDRDRSLLTAIFDLCSVQPHGAVGIEAVADRVGTVASGGRNVSAKGVTHQAKRLEALGVFGSQTVRPPDKRRGRPPLLYVFDLKQPPGSVEVTTPSAPSPPLPANQLDLFDKASMLEELWDDRLRIDDFWCGLIASALPISNRARLSLIETAVHYRGHDLPLQIATRHGNRIPSIRTMKTVIALLSLVEKIIQNQRSSAPDTSIDNRFVIDLRHVLQLLGLPNKGGNRRTVVQYLKQWEDTVFRFQELHPNALSVLQERYGAEAFGFHHHQLISQLCGVGELRDKQKIPTLIGLQLPAELVQRIADEGTYNLFSVTPAIMEEEDPLAIALHLYCRKSLGHKRNVLDIRLRTLWQRIGRSMTYRDFKHAFHTMLDSKRERMAQDPDYQSALKDLKTGDNQPPIPGAVVLGYWVIAMTPETLTLTVDLDDPYVGQHSRHAQLKHKTNEQAGSGLRLQLARRLAAKKTTP